ncbi:MAG: hypothetical protein J6F31_07545 [Oscillospiraceae bacterium]|nr:hypothetical protein [Oscillospiraceae bacterium]
MKKAGLFSVCAVIGIAEVFILIVIFVILSDMDLGSSEYLVYDGEGIEYINTFVSVCEILCGTFLLTALPLLILSVIGAVRAEAGRLGRAVMAAASVVIAATASALSVADIFAVSVNDEYYRYSRYYTFETDRGKIVIGEYYSPVNDRIGAFRITDDSHAVYLGDVESDNYTPRGKYTVSAEGDEFIISYRETVRDTDTEENSPLITTKFKIQ